MSATLLAPDRLEAGPTHRILVVDDELEIQEIVGELLTEVGYAVETVSSPEEALQAVARDSYDLVISDLRLPGCSGTTLVEEIMRRRPGLTNRIVLLTGELAGSTGRLPVIRKPFDVDAVLSVVQGQLDR
jgi:DNA-binding NtrC family response regulator